MHLGFHPPDACDFVVIDELPKILIDRTNPYIQLDTGEALVVLV